MRNKNLSQFQSIIHLQVFFLVALLAKAGISYGQDRNMRDYVSVDTILNFKQDHTNIYMRPTETSWKHYFAFTNFNVNYDNDTANIYIINTQDYSIDTLRFYSPNLRKTIKNHKSTNFKAIAMNDNRLVVLDWRTAIVFDKRDGEWHYSKCVKIKESYQMARLTHDGLLLLEENYDGRKVPVSITLFDLDKEKVIKRIAPYYNTPILSYIGNYKLFDHQHNRILLCNSNHYSYYLFDENLRLTDSVSHPTIAWTPLSEETLMKVNAIKKHYAADKIAVLMEDYKKIDVIIGSFFLDENHILIARNQASKTPYRSTIYDVWSCEGGKWSPLIENIEDDFKKPDYQRNHITLGYGYGQSIRIAGQKIVRLSINGTVESPLGMSHQEYAQKDKEYLQENDPYVQVFFFSHNLTQCNQE